MRLLYRAIWIPSLLALIGSIVFLAKQPLSLAAPGPETTFTSSDKSITVSHPDNWQPHEMAANGMGTTVEFRPSVDVKIRIATDLQNSLLADMSKSPSGTPALPGMEGLGGAATAQKSPLDTVHAMQPKLTGMDKWDDYQEDKTTPMQISGQAALVTEFTYKKPGLFGSQEMWGERATALLSERALTVRITCPKAFAAQYRKTLDGLLASIQVNATGG